MPKEYLSDVYDLETQSETDAFYSEWAATYDQEITRNGYLSPQRSAEALKRFVEPDTPILDVGCGTGLSGAAFAAAGFTDISGADVNPEMLGQARSANVYRELWVADLDDPFPFVPGTYGALAAIGVIGKGAGPSSLLGEALGALASGGHLVFTYNDFAIETPEFTGALDDAIESGLAEKVFGERGPHFTSLNSSSTVFVLRRT